MHILGVNLSYLDFLCYILEERNVINANKFTPFKIPHAIGSFLVSVHVVSSSLGSRLSGTSVSRTQKEQVC